MNIKMKITKQELAKIVAEETLNYYRFKEGRLISKGFTNDLVNQMNQMADALNALDPSSLDDATAAELNAAQQALNSSLEGTFGDLTDTPVSQPKPSTLGEGCGDMSVEPMPMPGPPPEGFDSEMHAMEPSYDDHEGRMAKSQLYKMSKYSEELMQMLGDQDQLPAWVQAKITKAADYLGAVKNHLEYEHASPEAINENFEIALVEVGEELDEGKIADAFAKMLSKISEKYFGALERILEKWHDKVGDKNINKVENFILDLQDKLTKLSNRFQGTTKFDYEKEGMIPPHVTAIEWKSMDPEQKKAAYAKEAERKI
jgi:hypothetical protein